MICKPGTLDLELSFHSRYGTALVVWFVYYLLLVLEHCSLVYFYD